MERAIASGILIVPSKQVAEFVYRHFILSGSKAGALCQASAAFYNRGGFPGTVALD
jgi:hypothetical protein